MGERKPPFNIQDTEKLKLKIETYFLYITRARRLYVENNNF